VDLPEIQAHLLRHTDAHEQAKTVANHVEHIYAKIDASNRAAASLFAMQNGLLPEEEVPAGAPARAVSRPASPACSS
jgi:hypothetical protein